MKIEVSQVGQRNTRSDLCRSCWRWCESGQGYLYRDTYTFQRGCNKGQTIVFLKCEKCYSGGEPKYDPSRDVEKAKKEQFLKRKALRAILKEHPDLFSRKGKDPKEAEEKERRGDNFISLEEVWD